MTTPPFASTRELASRLLALEKADPFEAERPAQEAVRVCEKLQSSLTRFAGPDGFAALLRRAVVLARKEVPSLQGVTVRSDGRLEGLEERGIGQAPINLEAATAIAAHLLGLLITFIGEPLTLRLVSEAWPHTASNKPR